MMMRARHLQVQLLQTKLHNKVEALLAVSRDLAECQKERDSFANECEALRDRVKDTEVTLDVRQEVNSLSVQLCCCILREETV